MARFWIVVASLDHVRSAVTGGFIQAGHGKLKPLQRMHPGDGVVCYSPTRVMGNKDPYRRFSALGFVIGTSAYQVHVADDFEPFRIDVRYENCPITRGCANESTSVTRPGSDAV